MNSTIWTDIDIDAVKKRNLRYQVLNRCVKKAISHITVSRLLDIARRKVVQSAKRDDIEIKETFEKEGK